RNPGSVLSDGAAFEREVRPGVVVPGPRLDADVAVAGNHRVCRGAMCGVAHVQPQAILTDTRFRDAQIVARARIEIGHIDPGAVVANRRILDRQVGIRSIAGPKHLNPDAADAVDDAVFVRYRLHYDAVDPYRPTRPAKTYIEH